MGLATWALVGLVAGALAKLILPGEQGGGIVKTMLLGVVGAMVGGFVSTSLGMGDVSGFNVQSIAVAVGGAIIVLMAYGFLRKRK